MPHLRLIITALSKSSPGTITTLAVCAISICCPGVRVKIPKAEILIGRKLLSAGLDPSLFPFLLKSLFQEQVVTLQSTAQLNMLKPAFYPEATMLVEFLIKVAIAPLLFASAFMNRPVLEVFSVDGRRMEPPISIAVVRHANRSERYSVKNLCSESWPNGEPLSWFLLFHLGTHQINNLFDLLRRAVQSHNNSAHGNFYLQPWCSNSILPSIINGRPIVRINETSDGKEYNVAYRTPDGDNVSSIIHNVVDGALNSADGNLLFRNLTLLKQVEYALQNNDATEAYAVHNTYGEEYYINAFGMPITSNVVEWEFEIMFCKHSGVKPFCLESQSRSVLGVEYEFCQRCKHGLQGINCQLDSNECREDDVSETVNVWHIECKESDVAS
ncbi:hypothetical protein M514_27369, partial [Trichuris suis]